MHYLYLNVTDSKRIEVMFIDQLYKTSYWKGDMWTYFM